MSSLGWRSVRKFIELTGNVGRENLLSSIGVGGGEKFVIFTSGMRIFIVCKFIELTRGEEFSGNLLSSLMRENTIYWLYWGNVQIWSHCINNYSDRGRLRFDVSCETK